MRKQDHLRIVAAKCRFLPAGRVTDDTSILTLKHLVFEPLTMWREGGLVGPALFARWEVAEEGRRWRFHLRHGAAWHDGVACTTGQILDFIRALLDSTDTFGMPWPYARYLASARLAAPTPTTLTVENPTPFADILDIFSEFFPCRDTPEGDPVLGTDPYRVAAYANEEHAELLRAAPGEGPRRVTVRAVPAAADRLAALRGGEAEAAMNLERLEEGPDFRDDLVWERAVNTLSVMYYLNCAEGAFAHPAARRAVNHAVDGQAIIDGLFHGLGVRASTAVSPRHLGMADPPPPFRHDPDLAKRLFEEARTTGPLLIRTPLTMPERSPLITAAVAESLGHLGIATRIETQPDRPEYAREVGRKRIGDMAIFDSSPHSTFRVLNDKLSAVVRGLWWQGHDDPALEALIGAANRTVDDAAREAAYGRALRRLHDNPPWLYLFHPVEVAASRPGTATLRLDSTGALHLRR